MSSHERLLASFEEPLLWPASAAERPAGRDATYLEAFQRFDFKTTVADTEFVVFDTETTGLHAKKGDRIISISAVRLREGRIDLADAFHEMVNPNRDIPATSAVIHEILPRMVAGKPAIDRIMPEFIRYIGSSVLVAHHEWLDMSSSTGDGPVVRFSHPKHRSGHGCPRQVLLVKRTPVRRGLLFRSTVL